MTSGFFIGNTFQIQKRDFSLDTSGITGEAAICPQHSVTGNDDGNGVVSHCAAYGLGGHMGDSALLCDHPGNLPVGYGLSIGDG